MERKPDLSWYTYTGGVINAVWGTPGAENSDPAAVTELTIDIEEEKRGYPALIISEIQTDGQDSADEFIEIFNPADHTVSMDNWTLKKKNSSGTESSLVSSAGFVDKKIASREYLVIVPQNYSGSATSNLTLLQAIQYYYTTQMEN
jgi:hypothetical protein